MNNATLQIKFQQRLNKLSSSDFINIESWMIVEAFNKGMDSWTLRQLDGKNNKQETAEGSIISISKLQVLLTPLPLTMLNKGIYWDCTVPENYIYWSRISAYASLPCCPDRRLKIYLGEDADTDFDLLDTNRQPSYEWAETFATFVNNTIRLYTNEQFSIITPILSYYRKPKHIQITGVENPDTGVVSTVDVECEFLDIFTELIIEEGVAILAGDLGNYQKRQIALQTEESSN